MSAPIPSDPSLVAFNHQLDNLTQRSAFLIINKREENDFVLSTTRNISRLIGEWWGNFFHDECSMRNDILLEAATISFLEKNKHLINSDNKGKVEKLAARVGWVAQNSGKNKTHEDLTSIVSLIGKNTFGSAKTEYLDHFLKQQEPEFNSKYQKITKGLHIKIPLSQKSAEAGTASSSLTGRVKSTQPVTPLVVKPMPQSIEAVAEHVKSLEAALKDEDLSNGIKLAFETSIHQWNQIKAQANLPKFNEDLIIFWESDHLLLQQYEKKSLEEELHFFDHLAVGGKKIIDREIHDAIKICEEQALKITLPTQTRACLKVAALLLSEYQNTVKHIQSAVSTERPEYSSALSDRQFVEQYVDWVQDVDQGKKVEKLKYSTVKELLEVVQKTDQAVNETTQVFTQIQKSLQEASPVLLGLIIGIFKERKDLSVVKKQELVLTLLEKYSTRSVKVCLSDVLSQAQQVLDQKGVLLKSGEIVTGLKNLTSDELTKNLRQNQQAMEQWSLQERATVELASLLMTQSTPILITHREYLGKEYFAQDSCQNLSLMLHDVEDKLAVEDRERKATDRLNIVRKEIRILKITNPLAESLLQKRMSLWKEGVKSAESPTLKRANTRRNRSEALQERKLQLDQQERMLDQVEWMTLLHIRREEYEGQLRAVSYTPFLLPQSKAKIEQAISRLTLLKTSMPIPGYFGMKHIPIDELDLQDAILTKPGVGAVDPKAIGVLSSPQPNTWAAYEEILYKEVMEAKWLLGGTDGRPGIMAQFQRNISERLIAPCNKLYRSLHKLVAVADETGMLRKALGQWRGKDSKDNRALDDFFADQIPSALHDTELLAHFTRFLDLVEKGIINSGQLNKDAKGNLVSENKKIDACL